MADKETGPVTRPSQVDGGAGAKKTPQDIRGDAESARLAATAATRQAQDFRQREQALDQQSAEAHGQFLRLQDQQVEAIQARNAAEASARDADGLAKQYQGFVKEGTKELTDVEREAAAEKDPVKAADLRERADRIRASLAEQQQRAEAMRARAEQARAEASRLDQTVKQVRQAAHDAGERESELHDQAEEAEAEAERLEAIAKGHETTAANLDAQARTMENIDRALDETEPAASPGASLAPEPAVDEQVAVAEDVLSSLAVEGEDTGIATASSTEEAVASALVDGGGDGPAGAFQDAAADDLAASGLDDGSASGDQFDVEPDVADEAEALGAADPGGGEGDGVPDQEVAAVDAAEPVDTGAGDLADASEPPPADDFGDVAPEV